MTHVLLLCYKLHNTISGILYPVMVLYSECNNMLVELYCYDVNGPQDNNDMEEVMVIGIKH